MRKRGTGRFRMLVAMVVGVTISVFGAQPLHAGTRATTLKVQASWPSGLTLYDNLKMFAERVEKMSNGRLKIEHLPGGAVVGPFEVLDATHRGVIDGAHSGAAYWVGKHKAAGLLANCPAGPFGMDYIDWFGWVYEGGGWELYQEFYQQVLKMNVVAIPILPAGPQALGWFKRTIKDWDDFKGMKYRIPGIAADVFKEAGMSVVTLPGAEILPAAERGVIDAAEWVGGIEDMRLGFHNVWKVHYAPGIHEPATVADLYLNKDVWDKISPDLQEIIKAAATETFFRWFVRFHKQNAEAYKELVEKHNVQVHRTPDDVLLKFLETWDQIAEREAAKDPFFKKVLDSQRQYAGLVVPYRLSTWPMYEFAGNYYWKDRIYGRAAKE
ncbi:MAG TPA: TRAP transporter substrate-binding protein [Alphaproteobacteria bacterium]|nr:TRAP transporter substrate-binding protein [Alphaproteobacteria bacterium]